MMKKCSRNLVVYYIIDENISFCIPTKGYFPVIIDFGFSYIKEADGNPLWPSLNHTEFGFLSDRFDNIVDPKLFLVTVSGEIDESRNLKNSKKLLNITKNIYGKLPIDWESGWDNDTKKCATDKILKKFSKYSKYSTVFNEYEYFCIDLLQTLIILPLEEQSYENIEISFVAFLNEFKKIENEIGNHFFCIYILKSIIDSARIVRVDYMNEEKEISVGFFKEYIVKKIDSISKYCRLKNIHYEKMLCGLLCLTKCIEGILYEEMKTRFEKKKELYKNVPVQNIEEIVNIIDFNIKDDYRYNENTSFLVVNNITKKCYPIELPNKDINKLNNVVDKTKILKKFI